MLTSSPSTTQFIIFYDKEKANEGLANIRCKKFVQITRQIIFNSLPTIHIQQGGGTPMCYVLRSSS